MRWQFKHFAKSFLVQDQNETFQQLLWFWIGKLFKVKNYEELKKEIKKTIENKKSQVDVIVYNYAIL